MTPIVVAGLVAPWAVVGVQTWVLHRLLHVQNQILIKQDDLQLQLDEAVQVVMSMRSQAGPPSSEPLKAGTHAPEFSLPDLSGRERRLQEFLGGALVVLFFNPQCSFCMELAPRLGQLPADGRRLLVISRGDPDDNLSLATRHNWRCDVLLDSTGQITQTYRVSGTPMGYLLDEDGRVASDLAVGAEPLLALVAPRNLGKDNLSAESLREKQQAAVERARQAGLSLRESRINRQGLAPGVKAPGFALPDLSGTRRTLGHFLNKRVLLIFSDPNCGPCDALAPDLVRIHEQHLDDNLNVVMISRGDPQANRAKANKHGFPFPVLLQKHWEVSKDYAMFATPIGYLIGPDGEIVKPVAVGKNAILGLV